MTELDPDTFDIDAWLDGATRPETVVPIYREGALLAQMDDLKRRIEVARRVPDEDRGITDDSPDALQGQWDDLAQRWQDSRIDLRVRALTSAESKKARKAGKEAGAPEEDLPMWEIASAVVSPKVTPEQVVRLREQVGEGQVALLYAEVVRLSNEAPRPTAPFSRAPSRGTRG